MECLFGPELAARSAYDDFCAFDSKFALLVGGVPLAAFSEARAAYERLVARLRAVWHAGPDGMPSDLMRARRAFLEEQVRTSGMHV